MRHEERLASSDLRTAEVVGFFAARDAGAAVAVVGVHDVDDVVFGEHHAFRHGFSVCKHTKHVAGLFVGVAFHALCFVSDLSPRCTKQPHNVACRNG